ncbi:MAG: hypothetical protein WC279_13955 [Sulfurimonas sp.]|jgi:hypothetical protein
MDMEFRDAIKRLRIKKEKLTDNPKQYFAEVKESVVRHYTERLKELRPSKDFQDKVLKEAEILKDTHPDIYAFVVAEVDTKYVSSVEDNLRNAENLSYSDQWVSDELCRLDNKIKQVIGLWEFNARAEDI